MLCYVGSVEGEEKMLKAQFILKKYLDVVNKTWDTQYKIIEENLYDITHTVHVCRVDNLKKSLIGNAELLLDFGDGAPVILTPRGYYFGEAQIPGIDKVSKIVH
jgi:hypothetical protein